MRAPWYLLVGSTSTLGHLFQPVFHFPSHQVTGCSLLRKGWLQPDSQPPDPLSGLFCK